MAINTREDFIHVLQFDNVQAVLSDTSVMDTQERPVADYIYSTLGSWSDDNKAALLHFNGITENTPTDDIRDILMTVAAFHKKDAATLQDYLAKGVSTGIRLDYGLPLYSEQYDCGEDIFVCAVKSLVAHNTDLAVPLPDDSVGVIAAVKEYVDNSFEIRNLLQQAPNKAVITPNLEAIDYIIAHTDSYRDSNNNPVIVFIPGVIDVPDYPVTSFIEGALRSGGNINDTGFFGVPALVWSVIMGDCDAVRLLLDHGATINPSVADYFGNHSYMAWATATLRAAEDQPTYADRMVTIIRDLSAHDQCYEAHNSPEINYTPADYIPDQFSHLKPIVSHGLEDSTLPSDSVLTSELEEQHTLGDALWRT